MDSNSNENSNDTIIIGEVEEVVEVRPPVSIYRGSFYRCPALRCYEKAYGRMAKQIIRQHMGQRHGIRFMMKWSPIRCPPGMPDGADPLTWKLRTQ